MGGPGSARPYYECHTDDDDDVGWGFTTCDPPPMDSVDVLRPEPARLFAELEKARSDNVTAFADGYEKGFKSARAQMLAAGEVDDG